MPPPARLSSIPLPKGWPRTVRSAVIHAISLAQFSLTHTRSWATTTDSHVIRIGGTVSELGGSLHRFPQAVSYVEGRKHLPVIELRRVA